MKVPWPLESLFALLAAAGVSLAAEFGTNLPPAADTSLFETDPDNNLGGLSNIPAGTTAGNAGRPFRCRGLIRFDLAGLPANARVTAVSLTLQVVKRPFNGPGSVFGLSRVLRGWGEGIGAGLSSGTAARPGEATWNNRFHPSIPWTPAGGGADTDFVSLFSATNFVDGLGSYTFGPTPGLVADVQAWINDPGTNFGWMLLTSDEGVAGTARRFGSREDSAQAPSLEVQYVLGQSLLTISSIGIVGGELHFAFTVEANRTYTVEFRSLGELIGSWSTLTNLPVQLTESTIEVVDLIGITNRCYRIRTP